MSEFGSVNFQSISIVKNYNGNANGINHGIDYGIDYGDDINNGSLGNQGEYCATINFQGLDDKVLGKRSIRKDTYVSARIYGNTIREVLEESLDFIKENNLSI